ncbi:MAG: cytochrome o ubiquinol oxidase subunit IV [Candidatus Yonathbacteria bacterium CG10_big_fil_rev_8_21_14_0_10_43_136]|uniref:Cytochrome o ubiquinol oxidase subunit IV n=2 Tax=Parcubacteria group TaxID=1794811 RepID=A0A2M7Q4R6_9BACT|nr:MAG: cytochrome o ubiquinol oxidase subunit IV [Candidatus Nomurabacteria bacterium CG2_30_43_9]PIR40826.1 MAG: cytochrome o ubiquinol oxidase subunit IV [Candidatus Yonathbacteria bacterium CG10_big_fil_rev_8_21_14_0_10_43_136]PIX57204.1 MAG: cytochrome o ubiquinol oxidase subunit IV [Candidatus Yonathbacteria bacterium CG_4_10_14_3_um_filter_43_12]PIY58426.1 MAG: cytochrome o ubiquinol oxidase subunit IV [Candidatus Yonathbacteria bacterium CG_4_10_14_0_8_um_filter_43_17]PJC22132.1 MAG: cy
MTNDFKVIDEQYESGRYAMRSYVTGFVLSIILTLIPYVIVVNHMFGKQALVWAVVLFGVTQLLAQIIFFLHLSKKSKPQWNIIVFVFTVLIVAILVVGSLWVMYNLNYNMTDASPVNTNEGYIPQ